MIDIHKGPKWYHLGKLCDAKQDHIAIQEAREKTMAMRILRAHNHGPAGDDLHIRFDAMASHDITYVGIIQTARASGMKAFPLPYALTNCHNSLCAVGGTINEDDHVFGLSAAKKYGGVYVPAHLSVIHQYMREEMAGCGKMILGSDSHTRYGALGSLSIGEGGPELAKQLLKKTYDLPCPQVVAVELIGKPRAGVGPQDVALAMVKAVFANGFVKNKVMEFIGEGIGHLSMDFRNGIDVMTTETTCLSSIWMTDEITRDFFKNHGREQDYMQLAPEEGAYYDAALTIDLSKIVPMIALPFHPSNAYPITEFIANAKDLLREVEKEAAKMVTRPLNLVDKVRDGNVYIDQGIIAGCAGGLYENLWRAADILETGGIGNGAFNLSVYPASQPMNVEMARSGLAARLMQAGATLRTAFCGPCFGAGEVPCCGGLSIRHTTRNFPSREGARPNDNQIAYVALMDARSIAATAARGGVLTPATEIEINENPVAYKYDASSYQTRVYQGVGNPQEQEELILGPGIADWPQMPALAEHLVLEVASAIYDPVTTTDELIPSGETSSYRSNPMKLASFALSRKDPGYVPRAQALQKIEMARQDGNATKEVQDILLLTGLPMEQAMQSTGIGSLVFAIKPGDGSAREQAASCQKVLGTLANLCSSYATKRYRSNVINWGMLPFTCDEAETLGIKAGDRIVINGVREALDDMAETLPATLVQGDTKREITLTLPLLTRGERDVILAGCLINYYAAQ